MTIWKLTIFLAIVIVAAVATIIIIAAGHDSAFLDDIRLGAVKHLLELVVVIVVGGVIAALFKAREFTREAAAKTREESARKAQLRAQIHEDYLGRLGIQYRAVKSCRRALRAVGLSSKYEPPTHLSADRIVRV
jgi:uncharacterized membrane protein